MKPLSDTELEALLEEIESDRTECKESWAGSAPERAREAVCAFANDLPNHELPGVLFVGAKDDGTASGWAVTDENLRTLTVEKRNLRGADLAVVTVWPSDAPPVRYEGRIWIRIGSRRGLASAQDERILNEKRRYRDRHFEAQPVVDSNIPDVSRLAFEQEYLPKIIAADVLAANVRSYEERLASCGMILSVDEPIPTVLGILCIGISPRTYIGGAYIEFLRIAGEQLSDPIADEAEIDGTISLILRRLDEKLNAHLTTSVDFTSQETEVRKTPYPLVALQQLARNAILHRTYEKTNSPARFYWFNDRIEIISPGGPYGSVNAQNFGQPGRTDYRNPQLAAAFKALGYAQRFGSGIPLAREALAQNGNPPVVFQIEENFIAAIIRKAT